MYSINYLSRSFAATKVVGERKYKVTASAIQHQNKNTFAVDIIRTEIYSTVDGNEVLIANATVNATGQLNLGFSVVMNSVDKADIMTQCDIITEETNNYLVNNVALPQ